MSYDTPLSREYITYFPIVQSHLCLTCKLTYLPLKNYPMEKNIFYEEVYGLIIHGIKVF